MTIIANDKSLGQIAFEGYGTSKNTWEELTEAVQGHWQDAARAVVVALTPPDEPYIGDARITAYAILRPEDAPKGSKDALEARLIDAGLTGVETKLQRVDTNGYAFAISADGNRQNAKILAKMFGEENLHGNKPKERANARGLVVELGVEPWEVAGREGRFAREHAPG